MEQIKLIKGDCIEEMKKLESGSVDLVLTDPPYGTIKGLGGDIEKYKLLSNSTWDETLDTKEMFKECERVLMEKGILILFSQEPYTSKLITEAHLNLPFNYRMIWLKDHFANALISKKAPVSYFEDILVFSKKYDTRNQNPLREYATKVIKYIGKKLKRINFELGHRRAEHFFYLESTQFKLCTEEVYNELTLRYNLKEMEGYKEFLILKEINNKYEVTFNLQDGEAKKSNVLQYKKDYGGLHPTQKPVELLKDLIKTYSNEGNTILDFTMGSGSTGVACKETNRKFIGIELDEKYFKIAEERINKTGEQTKLD